MAVTYTDKPTLDGITRSIGPIGNAYNDALMEMANRLYKAECIHTTTFHGAPFKTVANVEHAIAGWVDRYNHCRLHGSLGLAWSASMTPKQPTMRHPLKSRSYIGVIQNRGRFIGPRHDDTPSAAPPGTTGHLSPTSNGNVTGRWQAYGCETVSRQKPKALSSIYRGVRYHTDP